MAMPGPTRIIAHRGACGHLPEHTLAAKCLAYGMGADFLEQDLIATRDRAVVVLHDLHLDDVTDVADIFPDRRRADGHFYVIDFDLAELGALAVRERRAPGETRPLYPERFRYDVDAFRIVSFDDELRLVRSLNETTGRDVGVYPEIKSPRWHREHGVDLSALVLDALRRNGYQDGSDSVFLQCFDSDEIRRLHAELETGFPLIQLVDANAAKRLAADESELGRVRTEIAGVGLPYEALLAASGDRRYAPSDVFATLSSANLLIHPYTFRREMPGREPAEFEPLLRFFIDELKVDALFCDQPDAALRIRDAGSARMDSDPILT